jgi:hypothetical protein
MPDLGPETPADTYAHLLQVDGGLTATLKTVEDGDGTDSPLQLATDEVAVDGVNLSLLNQALLAFTEGSFTITVGRDTTPSGDSYRINLPNDEPADNTKYLKVGAVTGGVVTLTWAAATGDAALKIGGTGLIDPLNHQPVEDSAGTDSPLWMKEGSVYVDGAFAVLGVFRLTDPNIQNHTFISRQAGTDYYLELPPDGPSSSADKFLKMTSYTGGGAPVAGLEFAPLETSDGVALLAVENVFTVIQNFNFGLNLSQGPLRIPLRRNTGTVTLVASEKPFQSFAGLSADANCTLPAAPDDGHSVWVSHVGTSFNVHVKNSGGTTLRSLAPGQKYVFVWDNAASAWREW